MKPYAELLEFNQPNPIRKEGFARIRDSFPGLTDRRYAGDDDTGELIYTPERIMEFAGRWDYGSKNAAKLGQMSKKKVQSADENDPDAEAYIPVPIIQKWLASGEESMIEMGHATFFVECSRVVSHELVRHRLASFQQESQRFTKYEDMDLQEWEDSVYYPEGLSEVKISPSDYSGDTATEMLFRSYKDAFYTYKRLRAEGVAPQLARYVLPNAMRTRMIVSANIREWRHILKLRLHSSAQPEMRELMQQIYDQLIEVFPNALNGVLEGERGTR